VFSLLRGAGNQIGEALVEHPLIKGVTFTGSEAGGMALYRRAQQRPDPIPVFTEMTSVNPTFVFPAALAARGGEIGDGFGERMLVNVGQACLKPAIVLAVDGRGFAGLREALASRIAAMPARTMLTPGISKAYRHNVERQARAGATRVTAGGAPLGQWEGQAILSEVDGEGLLADPTLAEEVFGPAALLVRLRDIDQLFAAMHIDREDFAVAARLLPVLERRTGRIVVNAFAHPQEVSFAAIHGGPFPATSDSRFTSVGMSAIERFLRPVCYQGFPDELLPEPLKQANPLGLPRLVDGDIVSGKA
jgi:NADP-dependent aldehyde dehydrogenase